MDLRIRYSGQKIKKADILHSSGYAKAQSGKHIGSAAVTESFEARQAVEQRRKYVQKYRNSRLIQSAYCTEHAKTYVPRVEQPTTSVRGRGSLAANPANSGANPAPAPAPLPPNPSFRPSPISFSRMGR